MPEQRIQAGDGHRDLGVEAAGVPRLGESEAGRLVVIVQEGREESAGLAVGTDQHALAGGSALHVLAVLEQSGQRRRGRESLEHPRQGEEQREVQRRVDADEIVRVTGEPPGVLGDLLLVVQDFPEGEEVLLANAERELTNGVAERQGELAFDVFERVDAEAVDVELRDDVLVRRDERVAGGELEAPIRGQLAEVGGDLLQRLEVADNAERRSLPSKEPVVPEFVREHRGVLGQFRVALQVLRSDRPLLLGRAVRSAPADRVRSVPERCLRSDAFVFEHVTGVVDDDIENHIDAAARGPRRRDLAGLVRCRIAGRSSAGSGSRIRGRWSPARAGSGTPG